jgi:hypothetical protein
LPRNGSMDELPTWSADGYTTPWTGRNIGDSVTAFKYADPSVVRRWELQYADPGCGSRP